MLLCYFIEGQRYKIGMELGLPVEIQNEHLSHEAPILRQAQYAKIIFSFAKLLTD